MIKLGILGCGNMGGAIMRGWAKNPALGAEVSLYAYDREPDACKYPKVTTMNSSAELAGEVDWLLLALKPQYMPEVLSELKPALGPGKLLVSIAAGLSIARLKELSGGLPVIRVMPNTPALVGQGIFGLCFDDKAVGKEQTDLAQRLFAAIGSTLVVPEGKFNAFTAFSGGGPAYIYYLLDALVEAGVTLGFTREESTRITYALSKGSLALAEESGKHLAVLREQVCSPGGTTIEAINHLDRSAVRASIVDALLRACEKGGKLG